LRTEIYNIKKWRFSEAMLALAAALCVVGVKGMREKTDAAFRIVAAGRNQGGDGVWHGCGIEC
jgi:hypothetical protein